MFATSNLGGWFGDYLIHQRKVPTATARKLVNTMGKLGQACWTMLAGRTSSWIDQPNAGTYNVALARHCVWICGVLCSVLVCFGSNIWDNQAAASSCS